MENRGANRVCLRRLRRELDGRLDARLAAGNADRCDERTLPLLQDLVGVRGPPFRFGSLSAGARCRGHWHCRLSLSETRQTLFRRPSYHPPMQVHESLFSSTPETPAPQLRCPHCSAALVYRQTVFTFLTPIERWDYLDCRLCGPFDTTTERAVFAPRPAWT